MISRALQNSIDRGEAHARAEKKIIQRFYVKTDYYNLKHVILIRGVIPYETYQSDGTEVFLRKNKNDYSVSYKTRNREDKITGYETKHFKNEDDAKNYMDTLHKALDYANENKVKHFQVLSKPEKYSTTRGIGSTGISGTGK